MALSPKVTETKIAAVASAWETLAADKSIAGMTLAEFTAAVKPSADARTEVQELGNQFSAALSSRDDADKETNRIIALIVNGVKGDVQFGEDSALYEAMGYVRKSERKSGLTRIKKTTPA